MKKLGFLLTGCGIGIGIVIMFATLVMPKIKAAIFDGPNDNLKLSDFTILILNISDAFSAHLISAGCSAAVFIFVGTALIRHVKLQRFSN